MNVWKEKCKEGLGEGQAGWLAEDYHRGAIGNARWCARKTHPPGWSSPPPAIPVLSPWPARWLAGSSVSPIWMRWRIYHSSWQDNSLICAKPTQQPQPQSQSESQSQSQSQIHSLHRSRSSWTRFMSRLNEYLSRKISCPSMVKMANGQWPRTNALALKRPQLLMKSPSQQPSIRDSNVWHIYQAAPKTIKINGGRAAQSGQSESLTLALPSPTHALNTRTLSRLGELVV